MSRPFDRAEKANFADRSWKRADLAEWDEKWARLSPAARRLFAEELKVAHRATTAPIKNSAARLNAKAVEELTQAGFVEVQEGARGAPQLVVPAPLNGYAARLRALARYELLRAPKGEGLHGFISHAYDTYRLHNVVSEIVERAINRRVMYAGGNPVDSFVLRSVWPDWVVASLKSPVAGEVLGVIAAADGPLPIHELAGRLPGHSPELVRAALDALVAHLAVMEDIDPKTYELLVGLHPQVLEVRRRRAQAPTTGELPAAVVPADLGPEGGLDIPDLQSFLLELASQPARLKQDHHIFVKEHERFFAAMPPLPDWLHPEYLSPEGRLRKAVHWARFLGLVHEVNHKSEGLHLDLSKGGRRWLSDGPDQQFAAVYRALREPPSRDAYMGDDDSMFLGGEVVALTGLKRPDDPDYYWGLRAEQRQPLRQAVYRALSRLAMDTFYPLDELVEALARGGPQQLLDLGTERQRVRVMVRGRVALPLDEELEDLAAILLRALFGRRLVPLGAVQLGRDQQGRVLVARQPQLDLYFGHQPPADAARQARQAATRVLVQPDFTVVVIGTNPAVAAALAPFCDRTLGNATAGAITYRLSRESVLRGVASGLKPEDIIGRLTREASGAVPANVLTQLESWCGRARTVKFAPVMLLTCPDAETASRVMEVVGKKGKRVADALVSLETGALNASLRSKLRSAGLMLEGP